MSRSRRSPDTGQISILPAERIANPKRIGLARRRRGINQSDLAKLTGLHRRSVCGFESGEYQPSEGNILRLADILAFPTDFFYGDDIDEPTLTTGSFRSMSRMSAVHRDMALSQAAIGFHVSRWLETRFQLPTPTLPNLRHEKTPLVAADSLRRAWGIGELTIRNMIHLLESKGVRVFSLAVDAREVDAFSMWKGKTPFVFLNTNKSSEHSRFDAAHELGHLVMHRESPLGLQAEREADAFASAFLMPTSSILARAPRFPTMPMIVTLKRQWGVSAAALIHRLHAVGLISDWQYRGLCVEMTKLGYRESEPEEMPRETSLILPKILESLYEDGFSRRQVANILAISLAELESLLFGLVLTGIEGGRQGRATARSGSLERIK
jgi:Zn-dependent peptidase ImmA (M78 family)/DNA-binding XRE family transcriptional regulator